jgi:cation diffusion facilitator family transporter
MHHENIELWHHDHIFAQDQRRPGERRTLIVIAITAVMMVIEVFSGVAFGSMALLADGLHMASHAVALAITAFAYIYARRNAHNSKYSFGTGKVNALGGFTGAVLLATFAVFMGTESIGRLLNPVAIVFNQAIFVAVLGLLVNGACVFILNVPGSEHQHHQSRNHSRHPHHDHNLKAAYFHVMADALTSVLAIAALTGAKYFGFIWMDPVMGIVGAILVARWSYGLLGSTSAVLLDRQAPEELREKVRELLEQDCDTRVADLHVWSLGPETYSAVVSVVADNPKAPSEYKARIPRSMGLVHIAVEVHECVQHNEVA